MAASKRADDAHRNRLPDAERIADGKDHIADGKFVRIAECRRGQSGDVHFEDCQIGFRIGSNDLSRGLATIGERKFDFVRRLDDMMVRQYVAFRSDDHAGSETGAVLRIAVELVAEKAPEQRIVHERMPRDLDVFACKDVDDGGHRLLRRRTKRKEIRSISGSLHCFANSDDSTAMPRPGNEIGPERDDDKKRGEADGNGL